ncbi:MAG: hypothetical protein Q8903_12675 [Bacteroidota bacterium]|nr:hypothetical protein [Bacteroidota bacterium]
MFIVLFYSQVTTMKENDYYKVVLSCGELDITLLNNTGYLKYSAGFSNNKLNKK